MRETLEIGSSPADESCAQVGSANYSERAYAECAAFIAQLKRHYQKETGKNLPRGLVLKTKPNQHDFGTYYEVAASFDNNDEESTDAAYWLEGNSPMRWDTEARQALGLPLEYD